MDEYVKLSLIELSGEQLDTTLERLAARLDAFGEDLVIQFKFLSGDESVFRHIQLRRKQAAAVAEGEAAKAELGVVVKTATWFEIASGKLAPSEAWYTGRLFLRGDLELAKRMLIKAGLGTRTCPPALSGKEV